MKDAYQGSIVHFLFLLHNALIVGAMFFSYREVSAVGGKESKAVSDLNCLSLEAPHTQQ